MQADRSEAFASARGVFVLLAAVGLIFALVPGPVTADNAHTGVHIVDPYDPDLQATIFEENPGVTARLQVESRTSAAQSGVVVTELVTTADPVGVLIEGSPETTVRDLSSVFGVATPDTRRASYLRFMHVKTQESGPDCDSAPGTAFNQVTEFATLWVPPQGQAQIQFPMHAAHAPAGCAGEPCETEVYCVVAHLLSGGPVNASVTGPFD